MSDYVVFLIGGVGGGSDAIAAKGVLFWWPNASVLIKLTPPNGNKFVEQIRYHNNRVYM